MATWTIYPRVRIRAASHIALDPASASPVLTIAGIGLLSRQSFMSTHAPNLFFSVGEPSSDQHVARLISCISERDSAWSCRGFGGNQMRSAGCRIDFDLTQMAVMGIVEVLPKLREFFRVADIASHIFKNQRPDAVVLADFPGFNWHIAKRAKRLGIPVYYYLPPQLWAWAPWRIHKVRKYIDHVLSVLPFEHEWFARRGVPSTFVGHPFFDAVAETKLDSRLVSRIQGSEDQPRVAVLPGSRWHEVQRNWPCMLESMRRLHKRFPKARFAVAAFRDSQCLWCRNQMTPADQSLPVDFFVGKTSEIIDAAQCAMMVSGSVSLEVMARRTPAVVIYQSGRAMYTIGKALVNIPSITLPNLMAGKTIFPELATPMNTPRANDFLTREMSQLIGDIPYRRQQLADLDALRLKFAQPGATTRAASRIAELLGAADARPNLQVASRALSHSAA